MDSHEIDYAYTAFLLRKINALTYQGVALSEHFFYEGYNVWHWYQERLFEEIKIFSATRQFHRSRPTSGQAAKAWVVGAMVTLCSFIAYIWLVISRKKVLVYSADRANSSYGGDFRLEALYAALRDEHVSYLEVFHTIPGRMTIANMRSRRRVALYLESLDWPFRLSRMVHLASPREVGFVDALDLSAFSDDEKRLVKYLVATYVQYIDVSLFKVRMIGRLLSLTAVTTLFAIDDTRYYHELLLGCHIRGIATRAIQHGHITKYHRGWLKGKGFTGQFLAPDMMLVWSRYWKDELIRLESVFPHDRIIIGGVKEKLPPLNKRTPNASSSQIAVLIPYETVCPKAQVARLIHEMLACPQVEVVFKLRPDVPVHRQLAEYGLREGFHERFTAVAALSESMMQRITIVAGVYSTFLYDMIAYDTLAAILETDSDYGEGMVINGLADKIMRGEPMCVQLAKLKSTPRQVIQSRRETLYGKDPALMADTLRALLRDV